MVRYVVLSILSLILQHSQNTLAFKCLHMLLEVSWEYVHVLFPFSSLFYGLVEIATMTNKNTLGLL